jgi:hypothetical protein
MHGHEFDRDGHELDIHEQASLGRELRRALGDVEHTRKRLSWVGRLVIHRRFDDALSLIDAASSALRHLRRTVLAVQSTSLSSRPPRIPRHL